MVSGLVKNSCCLEYSEYLSMKKRKLVKTQSEEENLKKLLGIYVFSFQPRTFNQDNK